MAVLRFLVFEDTQIFCLDKSDYNVNITAAECGIVKISFVIALSMPVGPVFFFKSFHKQTFLFLSICKIGLSIPLSGHEFIGTGKKKPFDSEINL